MTRKGYEWIRLPNGQIVEVKVDDYGLFDRGGTQYRVDREEWLDDDRHGYIHSCEALGPP